MQRFDKAVGPGDGREIHVIDKPAVKPDPPIAEQPSQPAVFYIFGINIPKVCLLDLDGNQALLYDNSGRTFISGASEEKRVKIEDRTKKNLLRKIGKAPYSVERKLGRVTLRKMITEVSDWSVQIAGACVDVNELLAKKAK